MSIPLLTVRDASQRLHVSPSLVYAEIRSGRMSHVRIAAGAIRISEQHLAEYIAAREVPAWRATKSGRVARPQRRPSGAFRHLDVSRVPTPRI